MSRRSYCSVVLSAFFFFAVIGCSNAGESGSAPPNTPTSGPDGELTKRSGPPQLTIESVGPIASAWKLQSFALPAQGKFKILGWAIDSDAKAAAGGINFIIDGTSHPAQYGSPRPDIASGYKIPAYEKTGFSLELTADDFTHGPHKMSVHVLSSDRTSYWDAGPYTIEFQ